MNPGRTGPRSTPKILAIANGFAPGQGSEHGVGWAWGQMLASIGPTWLLTRPWPDIIESIERELPLLPPERRVTVVYVELPRLSRFAVSGDRRARHERFEFLERFEYMAWQFAALRAARRLHREVGFDLVWHLTWANVWMGSIGALLGPRFIYGPVGGGAGPPWRVAASLGPRPLAREVLRSCARGVARYLNPLARVSWRKASLVLVQNPETRQWLPPSARGKTVLFPNAALEDGASMGRDRQPGPRTALFAGRLIGWKGPALAIEAMRHLPDWRLLVCGTGPDEALLRREVDRLALAGRVEFLGQRDRQELMRIMQQEADVFLFPSLRDEGPWAVAEALQCGLPVVCLDSGGPPALGGTGIRATTRRATVRRLAAEVRRASRNPSTVAPRSYDLEDRRIALRQLLEERGLVGGESESPE